MTGISGASNQSVAFNVHAAVNDIVNSSNSTSDVSRLASLALSQGRKRELDFEETLPLVPRKRVAYDPESAMCMELLVAAFVKRFAGGTSFSDKLEQSSEIARYFSQQSKPARKATLNLMAQMEEKHPSFCGFSIADDRNEPQMIPLWATLILVNEYEYFRKAMLWNHNSLPFHIQVPLNVTSSEDYDIGLQILDDDGVGVLAEEEAIMQLINAVFPIEVGQISIYQFLKIAEYFAPTRPGDVVAGFLRQLPLDSGDFAEEAIRLIKTSAAVSANQEIRQALLEYTLSYRALLAKACDEGSFDAMIDAMTNLLDECFEHLSCFDRVKLLMPMLETPMLLSVIMQDLLKEVLDTYASAAIQNQETPEKCMAIIETLSPQACALVEILGFQGLPWKEIPVVFLKLTGLQDLCMEGAELTNIELLSQMSSLDAINFSFSQSTQVLNLPDDIDRLEKLRFVNFIGTNVRFSDAFFHLPNLEVVHVEVEGLDWRVPLDKFATLPKLNFLEFAGNISLHELQAFINDRSALGFSCSDITIECNAWDADIKDWIACGDYVGPKLVLRWDDEGESAKEESNI